MFPGRAIVFDLDDTLYPEWAFVESGFRAVLRDIGCADEPELLGRMWQWQRAGQPVFDLLSKHLGTSTSAAELLEVYRFHEPQIVLRDGAETLIRDIRDAGGRVGIVTDGRSRTQRAKMRALGLEPLVDAVVISEEVGSEKPARRNFEFVIRDMKGVDPVYVADNPRKDFIAPNALGWLSVMVLGDEQNIHIPIEGVGSEAVPRHRIRFLKQLRVIRTRPRE